MGGGGLLILVLETATFSAKRSKPTQWGTQYAVGVSAKRSTYTVDLANMGDGGLLLLVQKGHSTSRSERSARSKW